MKSICLLVFSILISGCTTQNAAQNFCSHNGNESVALLCVSSVAAAYALSDNKNEGRRCSEMSGTTKEECEAQVRKIKKHISNRKN